MGYDPLSLDTPTERVERYDPLGLGPEEKKPSYLEAVKLGLKEGFGGAARMYEIPFRPIVEHAFPALGIDVKPEEVLPSEYLKPTEEEHARVAQLGIPGQIVTGAAALPGAVLKYGPMLRGAAYAARGLGFLRRGAQALGAAPKIARHIPKIAAAAGIFPAERALEEVVHEGKVPSARELGMEAGVGGIFAGIEPLGRIARSAILSGTFSSQAFADTYAQTKDIKQALEAAVAPGVIGAGLGFLGPGRARPIPPPIEPPKPGEPPRLPWVHIPPYRGGEGPGLPYPPVPYRRGGPMMDMVWNPETRQFEPGGFYQETAVPPRPGRPAPLQIPYVRGLPRPGGGPFYGPHWGAPPTEPTRPPGWMREGREFPPPQYPPVPYTRPTEPKIGPPGPVIPPPPGPTPRLEDITPESLKIPILESKLRTVLAQSQALGGFSRDLIKRWAGVGNKRADQIADSLVKAGMAEVVPSPPAGSMPFRFTGKFALPGDKLRYAGEIRELRNLVSRGEPAKKIGVVAKVAGAPETVAWGTSYPTFMRDKGWTRADVLTAIDRGMRGDDFKGAPKLKEKWEAVKDEARGIYRDTVHEERMRRRREVRDADPTLEREETIKSLTDSFDDEIMGFREELRDEGWSEKDVTRAIEEVRTRIEGETLPPDFDGIKKALTDTLTQAEVDPVLSPVARRQFMLPGQRIGIPFPPEKIPARERFKETPLARGRLEERGPTLFDRGEEVPIPSKERLPTFEELIAESDRRRAERDKVLERYRRPEPEISPVMEGQYKLPGMKIGVEARPGEAAPPTLEGTPLMEAARRAEIERVQPGLFREPRFGIDDKVKTVTPEGKEFKGRVVEIDEDGTIRIGTPDGKMIEVPPERVEADIPVERAEFKTKEPTAEEKGLPAVLADGELLIGSRIHGDIPPERYSEAKEIKIGWVDKEGNFTESKPKFKTTEPRLSNEEFQRITNTYSKKNSPSKRIVENPEDLPEHILREIPEQERAKIQGAYDPVEGVTYLVRRNIENEITLRDVIDHEDIKHFALNTYLGKEAESWYERVYMKYGRAGLKDIAEERGFDLSTREGRIEAAKEKIARTPIDTPGVIKQFWAWLREKIAKVFPKMKVSDAEIQRNIKLAREAMERGELRAEREGPVEFATKLPPEEQRIQERIISKVIDPRNLKEKIRDAFDTFYTNYVSEWWPIEKKDPISGARLRVVNAKGYGVAQSALELGVPDINQIPGQPIKYTGEGFRQILSPVVDAKALPSFIRYGVSKRAVEKYHQGVETGFDYNDAVFTVNKYENQMIGNQTYAQIFDRLGTFQDNVLKYYRDSGMLSTDAYNMIKAKNLMYFPFYRALEEMGPEGIGRGSQALKVLKRMKGTDKPILDPVDNIVKNTYNLIANAEKNLALREFVARSPHLVTELKPGMPGYSTHRHSVSLYEMRKSPFFQELLEDADLGFIDKNGNFRLRKGVKPQLEDEMVGIFRPNFIKGKEDIFMVYEDGKARIFQTDKSIGRTLHAFDRESVSAVLRVLSHPTKLLRAGAILSPEFMVRNPFRDLFSAMVYAKYGFYPWDFFKGLIEFGRKGPDYYRWLQGGGSLSTFISLDRADLRDSVRQILHRKKIQGVISGDDYKQIMMNMIKSPIEALRAITDLSEMGTRLGIYKRALRKGAPELEAIMESKESTLDFSRIGAKGKALNMIIAFWNANVQGLDKLRRELNFINPETRPKALKTFAKASMTITIPSLLLAWANQDDPRYQELPEWQKALFWIIPTEKHLWRIPKPFELGIIFGSVPEYIMRWLRTNDPDTFKNMGNALLSGSTPGLIPTAVLPFVENWANKSFFTGRPIVPMGKQELKPQYQYQPYTSETTKWIAKQMASLPILGDMASPAKIENFIKGWSGGLGGHALRLLDEALISSGVAPEQVKPSKTLADIPVIRAFVPRYPGSDANSLQKFYEAYNEITDLRASVNELRKEGKIDEANTLARENLPKMQSYPMINKTHQAIKNMKGMIDKVYANPDMDPDEKRRLIEEVYMRMIEVAQNLNKRLRTMGALGG